MKPPRKNDILFWIGEKFLVKQETKELPFRQEKTRKWRAQISANAIKIRTTDGYPLANNGNVVSFWSVRRFLCGRTQNFVPRLTQMLRKQCRRFGPQGVEVNVMGGLFFLLDQCRQCFITSCFVTHLVLTAEHSHMHNLGWIDCN